jgi:DNA repair protein RadC
LTNFTYRAYEVDIRRATTDAPPIRVSDTEELVAGLREYYDGLDREVVIAVILDDVNRVLGMYEVSKGGVGEAPVEFANVFRPAILLGGTKVILVHNHPTGEVFPSDGDMAMAKGVFLIASLLDLEVADNIVLGYDSWRSVHDEPEFRRWLTEDLVKVAEVMASGVLTHEQREAQEKIREELNEKAEG